MSNELEKKVCEISEISQSQEDKLNPQNLIKDDLIDFLGSQIRKLSSRNDLKENLMRDFMNRMDDEDPEDPDGVIRLTNGQKLKLFEILSKDENDAISNILDVIKKDNGIMINVNEAPKSDKGATYTKENMGDAKGLLDVLDVVKKLKISESSIEELEDNIKKD